MIEKLAKLIRNYQLGLKVDRNALLTVACVTRQDPDPAVAAAGEALFVALQEGTL